MHTIYRQGLVPRHACTCHGTNDRLPLTSCRLSTAWQSIWFIIYVHEHDFETMIISPCHDAIDVLLQTKYMACTAMVLYQSNRIVETNQQKRCPHSRSRPEPKRDKVWLQQDRFYYLGRRYVSISSLAFGFWQRIGFTYWHLQLPRGPLQEGKRRR